MQNQAQIEAHIIFGEHRGSSKASPNRQRISSLSKHADPKEISACVSKSIFGGLCNSINTEKPTVFIEWGGNVRELFPNRYMLPYTIQAGSIYSPEDLIRQYNCLQPEEPNNSFILEALCFGRYVHTIASQPRLLYEQNSSMNASNIVEIQVAVSNSAYRRDSTSLHRLRHKMRYVEYAILARSKTISKQFAEASKYGATQILGHLGADHVGIVKHSNPAVTIVPYTSGGQIYINPEVAIFNMIRPDDNQARLNTAAKALDELDECVKGKNEYLREKGGSVNQLVGNFYKFSKNPIIQEVVAKGDHVFYCSSI